MLHKHTKQDQNPSHHYNGAVRILTPPCGKPAIAQLAEHLTVECSNQMVPGSIPGGRIMSCDQLARNERIHTVAAPTETSTSKDTPAHQPPQNPPLPHSWHACKKVMTNRGAKPPTFRSHGDPCTLLAVARKRTTSEEILLWMTPSEAPRALQTSECSELLDPVRVSCWISAQHTSGMFTRFRYLAQTVTDGIAFRR